MIEIRKDSKRVLQYLLNEALQYGNLHRETTIEDEKLTETLGFKNTNYLKVCFQYLSDKKLISSQKIAGGRRISICADAIDFIELN